MFEKTNNIRVCCNIALLKIYKNVIICICLGLNYTFKYIVIPRVKKIRLLLAISLRLDILIICIENSAAVSWRISHVRLCGFCWNISLLASSQNVLKAIEKFVFSCIIFWGISEPYYYYYYLTSTYYQYSSYALQSYI